MTDTNERKDSNDANNVNDANNENAGSVPEELDRRVFVSAKALVEKYGPDGSVEGSWRIGRNTYQLVDFLRGLPPESVVGIYMVEDEERSDPPKEGEKRQRMSLLPPTKDHDGNEIQTGRMTVVDAMQRLLAATTHDKDVLLSFHTLCDSASARSKFECASIVMILDGRPAGFSIINPYRDVPASSCALLYESARSQAERMKDELRRIVPGIRFTDDEGPVVDPGGAGIVLPDGSPAGSASGREVVTPQEAAQQQVGMRVVELR